MPTHDSLRSDNGYGVKNPRTATIEPNEQGTAGPVQMHPAWRALLQNIELMLQDQDFSFRDLKQSPSMRTKERQLPSSTGIMWTDGFAEGGVWACGRVGIGISFWRGRASGVRSHSAERRSPNVTVAYADDRRHGAGGFIPGTQTTDIDAVRKLAAYYRRSPDQLSEEEVRAYISTCVSAERRAAPSRRLLRHPVSVSIHGQPRLGAVRKRRSVCRDRSGCPARCPRRGPPAVWLHNEPDPQNLLPSCTPAVCGSARRRPLRSVPSTATTDCFALSVRVTKSGSFRCRNHALSLRRLWTTTRARAAGCFPRAPPHDPVGRGTLNRTFAAAAQAAGIGSATPHSLRHGYATAA